MLERLTAEDFEPLVGSDFDVVAPGTVRLILSDVSRHGHQPHAARTDPFSLVFAGPVGVGLRQQIWPLQHATIGRIDLFLVPIGPGPDGRPRYEAVFN